MKITITVTATRWTAGFDGCGPIWGTYSGSAADGLRWMTAGRDAMVARWVDVHAGERDFDECMEALVGMPDMALATMCAEWDG